MVKNEFARRVAGTVAAVTFLVGSGAQVDKFINTNNNPSEQRVWLDNGISLVSAVLSGTTFALGLRLSGGRNNNDKREQ